MKFFNAFRKYHLMEGEPDAPGGGGKPPPAQKSDEPPKPSNELDSLKNQNADLIKRLEAMEAKFKTKEPEGDLADKVRIQREAVEKSKVDQNRIANALKFTMGSSEWLKNNATLLPKTIPDLFVHAEKEKYGSEIEKADAIKVGIVGEFFSVQANLDLLTPSQKIILEDWKNLTVNERQARIQNVFDSVFEPTFESLRRETKARQLAKGHNTQSHSEDAYKAKLMAVSRKHYLGENKDA